jgi:hypothetical protein
MGRFRAKADAALDVIFEVMWWATVAGLVVLGTTMTVPHL